jgi:hypothetical protein
MRPIAMHPPAKTVEENVRKYKQPDCLPEGNEWSVENIGDKTIPQ